MRTAWAAFLFPIKHGVTVSLHQDGRAAGSSLLPPKILGGPDTPGLQKRDTGIKRGTWSKCGISGGEPFSGTFIKKTSGICHFVTKQRLESLVNTQAIHLGLETVFAQLKS